MSFSFSIFTFFLLAGGLVCLALAASIFSRRPSPGAVPMALLLLSAAVWTILCAFEAAAADLNTRIICTRISYLGVVTIGVFWLFFTLDYTGSAWWKRPRNLVLLCLVPLVTLVLAWTNQYHGWLWSRIYMVEGPLGPTSVWEHGPWYLVNTLYQFGLTLWGMGVLLRFGLRNRPTFLRPILVCLAAAVVPLIGTLLYTLGINPAGAQDVTPFYIAAAALIYCFTLLKYDLVNIIPRAYQLMVSNIADGVIVLDARHRVAEVNPVVEKLLGKDRSSIRGNHLSQVWPELEKALTASEDLSRTELTLQREKERYELEISLGQVKDIDHRLLGELVILRDVSERSRMEQHILSLYEKEKQQRRQLEEEARLRNMFVDVLAHELKNSLTPIVISSATLEELTAGDSEGLPQKIVRNIKTGAERMNRRLEELLDLARYSRGAFKLHPEKIEVRPFLEDVISRFQPSIDQRSQCLSVDIADNLPEVTLDPFRMEQVVINLLSNACKYSRERGLIRFRAFLNENGLQIEVQDNGIGISPEAQKEIFQPYHRVEKEGSTSVGMGLGLAICKQIVESHGGKIWVTSLPGSGSTFSLWIPVQPGLS